MANERARRLRVNMTDAERKLCYLLRKRQLDGYRFRRQHPIGPYVVDFVSLEAKLVVEIDGGQHNEDGQSLRDAIRTAFIERAGYRVTRFWNNEVLSNSDGVLHSLASALSKGKS